MSSKQFTLLFTLFFTATLWLQSQEAVNVTGTVVEKSSGVPLPDATIWLNRQHGESDHTISPTSSDRAGLFFFHKVPAGIYRLHVTTVGYRETVRDIILSGAETHDTGFILMEDTIYLISETVIVAERMAPVTTTDKVVYSVSSTMRASSGNTADMLKFIPGIRIDLQQQISLDGSENVMLLIDGRVRDISHLKRISPYDISKVEIYRTPPPEFSGTISGVISIVLKEGQEKGISSELYADIPATKSFVYSFPSANLHYNNRKIALQLSYNGEINYEHIDETNSILIRTLPQPLKISAIEQVRQRNLSHTFYYGLEYQLTPRDMLNFQGFYNPYSYEQDGDQTLRVTADEKRTVISRREENDNNLNIYNSLYYKHHFNDSSSFLAVDLNHARLKADNKITYSSREGDDLFSVINREKPAEHSVHIKADCALQAGERTKLTGGIHWHHQSMRDRSTGFSYRQQRHALYGSVTHQFTDASLHVGMRVEYAAGVMDGNQPVPKTLLLPFISFQYRPWDSQYVTFTYRRGTDRPSIFQLNPSRYTLNPYTMRLGNPLLEPSSSHHLQGEYSVRFRHNHLSLRLFHEMRREVIDPLTTLTDANLLVIKPHNLGDLLQTGIQLTALLKSGRFTVYPSVRLYRQRTSPNSQALNNGVAARRNLVFATELSSTLSLPCQIALSASLQYGTPAITMQQSTFGGTLYTLSADKMFGKNLQLGLLSAQLFVRSFVYQGSETDTRRFFSNYTGYLKLPDLPLMIRMKWLFHSGRINRTTDRERQELTRKPKRR